MSDSAPTDVVSIPTQGVPHDHAWRKAESAEQHVLVGVYKCDLCPAVWSM
jgi:hypothetical protein